MKRSPRQKRRVHRHFETLESRQLLAAISGEVFLDLNADGVRGPDEAPSAQVRVYLDDNDNGRFDFGEIATRTDAAGVYSFPQIGAGTYAVRIEPVPGQVQIAPSTTFGYTSVAISQPDGSLVRGSQLFTLDAAGRSVNVGQPILQRIDGLTRIASGALIAADTRDNRLFRINPNNGEAVLIGSTNLDIVDGLAYDPVADRVLTLVRDGFNTTGRQLASIDPSTARVTLLGGGLSGLSAVSSLTFDVERGRLIGFDDFDDEFFAFDRLGNGSTLSRASIPINLDVLTIPGRNWPGASSTVVGGPILALAFDANDRLQTQTLLVDVDTGIVTPSQSLAQPLAATSLHASLRGDSPQVVTVSEFQTLGGVNFSVAREVTGFRVTASQPDQSFGALGSIGLTVIGGAVGDDVVEVTLNRPPTSNVRLVLSIAGLQGGRSGAFLSESELVFTPTDWARPRRVTVSPDTLNPVVGILDAVLTVAVDRVNSDIEFRDLPQSSTAVRVLPPLAAIDPTGPVINELLVSPENQLTDQFIELRGLPNSVLPQGTYFVVINEEFVSTGEIETVIDLSGQQFGSNGFLAILQQGSPYQVTFGANVLRSDSAGFNGLPGGIFSSSSTSGELFDTIFDTRAASYFLIQSNTPVVIGQDIDTNNDGLADAGGVASGWTRYDAVAIHPFLGNSPRTYSPIVGINDPLRRFPTLTAEPGTTFVYLAAHGYAARIGDSIGSAADDWVFAEVAQVQTVDTRPDADSPTLLEIRGEDVPSVPSLFDRPLNHVGSSNFQGGARGRIVLTPSSADLAAGVPATTQTPGQGIRVLADTNGNGLVDDLTFVIDPDSVVPAFNPRNPVAQDGFFSLTSAFPGVTISTTSRDGERMTDEVLAERETRGNVFLGNRIFASGPSRSTFLSSTFWNPERLRFDFFRPVKSASIDFRNTVSTSSGNRTGVLEAFNAQGELISRTVSNPLTPGLQTTINIAFPGDEITRIEAYSDSPFFGVFDRLVYTQSEPTAITDQNGIYEIAGLVPGNYTLLVQSTPATGSLLGQVARNINVTRFQNFFFDDVLRPNSSPQANDDTITIDENQPVGSLIGVVPASDADQTSLRYELIGGGRGFLVNPLTGEITVAPGAILDFETQPQTILTVRVTDPSGDTVSPRVTINLRDINEPPVVASTELLITESVPNGTVVGVIPALDPDTARNQTLSYEVLGGTGAATFTVDPTTGVVRLRDRSLLSFQLNSTMTLTVRVTDNDPNPASVTVDQIIRIEDENDAPSIAVTTFTIPENSTGELFRLAVIDPDELQSHQFTLLSGSATSPYRISRDGVVSLREGAILDFEQGATRTFQVRVSDNGRPPLSSIATITLNLTNVPEPARLVERSVVISENVPNVSIALTLRDDDSDLADSSMRLLPGPDSGPFLFDSATNTLRLRPGVTLDREMQSSYSLNFEITDRLGLIQEPVFQTLVVNVLDVNEAPVILAEEFRVSEIPSITRDVIVGRIPTSDPENDRLTLSIIGGNAQSRFVLDPTTHVLSVRAGAVFDAETETDLVIVVRALDTGNNATDKTIRIEINDENEPPVFNPAAVSMIPELRAVSGMPFEVFLPSNLVSDPENQLFDIRVFGPDGTLPSWLEFDEATGRLSSSLTPLVAGSTTIGNLDPRVYVTSGTVPLTILAIERGPVPLSSTLQRTLTIENSSGSLQNGRDRFDVDNNGIVTALDALRVINYLVRADGSSLIDASQLGQYGGFLDVNGSGTITPLDALLVINEISRRRGLESSEPIVAVAATREAVAATREDRTAAVDEVLRDGFGDPQLF